MILLDEPYKFNWTIKYTELTANFSLAETILEGKCYDFIPRKHEGIVIDNTLYVVSDIIYDYDNSEIHVHVLSAKTVKDA